MFSLNSILLHPLFLCHLEQTCAFSNRPLQVKQQRIIFVSLDFYILVCNSRNSITRESTTQQCMILVRSSINTAHQCVAFGDI